MAIRSGLFFLIYFLITHLYAQTDAQLLMDSLMDYSQNMTIDETMISHLGEISEEWTYLQDEKVDINHADALTLRQILKLNDIQIYDLKSYLSLYGDMVSVYELAAIPSLKKDIARLLPYIEILPSKEKIAHFLKRGFTQGIHQIILKYQQETEAKKGYENGTYLGRPFYLSLKYQYNYKNKIRFGLSAEKDAGEPFFKYKQKMGFDFYGFHFFITDLKYIKTIAIGDYRLFLGQGLILGSQLFSGSITDKRYLGTSLKPYTSTAEYNFQRGIAIKLQPRWFTIHLFYSHSLLDGSLENFDTCQFVSTWTTSGLHRTNSENNKRYSFLMNSIGGHIEWTRPRIKLSLQGIYNHLSKPYYFDAQPYQIYYFQGQQSFNLGIAYQFLGRHSIFYGETACNEKGGIATLNGFIYRGIPLVDLTFIATYFSPKYYALTATGVSGNSHISNDIGFYTAAAFQLPKSHLLTFSLTADYYPEPSYNINAPSHHYRFKIRYTFPMRSIMMMDINYNWQIQTLSSSQETLTETLCQQSKHYLSTRLTVQLHDHITSKTTFIFSAIKGAPLSNMALYCGENLQLTIPKINLKFGFNGAVFYIPDYANRFYVYEQDLLYAFSIPMYYGKGIRLSLVLGYSYKFFNIQFKIGQNFTPDQAVRGSGNDEVRAYTKTEIKLQLIFKMG